MTAIPLDAFGRLVAVVDSGSNEAAIYRYDAVGNLTAIERQSASLVTGVPARPPRAWRRRSAGRVKQIRPAWVLM
jgi:YD repeat-containing protein